MTSSPVIHLRPATACHKAMTGILQTECQTCHILIDIDVQLIKDLPPCKNCGPTQWHYVTPAIDILNTLGYTKHLAEQHAPLTNK